MITVYCTSSINTFSDIAFSSSNAAYYHYTLSRPLDMRQITGISVNGIKIKIPNIEKIYDSENKEVIENPPIVYFVMDGRFSSVADIAVGEYQFFINSHELTSNDITLEYI